VRDSVAASGARERRTTGAIALDLIADDLDRQRAVRDRDARTGPTALGADPVRDDAVRPDERARRGRIDAAPDAFDAVRFDDVAEDHQPRAAHERDAPAVEIGGVRANLVVLDPQPVAGGPDAAAFATGGRRNPGVVLVDVVRHDLDAAPRCEHAPAARVPGPRHRESAGRVVV